MATALPERPYDPYVPDARFPWTLAAGHLLRRCAFGTTLARLEALAEKSPAAAVDDLLNYDPAADPFNHLLDELDGFLSPFTDPRQLQAWWVYRMLRTPRPFQERIALFWHNRFATSVGKIDRLPLMHQHIELFRQQGLGNYRTLLLAVGRDPAMLLWLDGAHSKKGKPNENYARELMELFTLGIGNYTEHDIQEVARAFTGWTIKDTQGILLPSFFDAGEKEIFGHKGTFNDEAVIDLILARPEAARFLSLKLLREFVHPAPPDAVVDHYAQALTNAKWELKPVLRELLTSRLFFSDWSYRALIKSPCELVVGTLAAVQEMGAKASVDQAVKTMTLMGQALLYPPSVKGWDGQEAWINANTMLTRMNFALTASTARAPREFTRPGNLRAFLEKRDLATPDKIVDHFARLFLDGTLPDGARAKFLAFLTTGPRGLPAKFALNPPTVQTRIQPLLHMILATPEYQLS